MSKYFKKIEEGMNVKFLAKLDEAREFAKIPFVINSAYRSPEHPESIKNPTSSHIKGLAVDISVKDSVTRFKVLNANSMMLGWQYYEPEGDFDFYEVNICLVFIQLQFRWGKNL